MRQATKPLDSIRLSQYAVQVRCTVCEGENSFDADRCRHCYAPLALSHQAAAQKTRPKYLAVLGGKGVGKTVFLALMIDMLSRQSESVEVFARGAFSVCLQHEVIDRLSRCEFPEPTPEAPELWNWIHSQVKLTSRRREADFVIPDFAGQSVSDELDHPFRQKVVRTYLNKCSAAVLIIDAERVAGGDESPDYEAMKTLSYLCELDGHRRRGWPARPIAIVFTKADRSDECRRNPRAFAEKRTPGLIKQCDARLRKTEFFATGAVGAHAFRAEFEGRTTIPLRIEPFGFVEPFVWLSELLI